MSAARLAQEAESIFEVADRENRPLTADERQHVESLLERAKERYGAEQSFKEFGLALGGGQVVVSKDGSLSAPQTPGERFTQSEGYKSILQNRGERWSTGMVEVSNQVVLGMKGTLLEGSGAPGSGTGGGWLADPQVVPGMVSKLFQPFTLESLLLSGQATGNTVRYGIEGTATSAAAGVAEGGTKPESTLAFSTVDEPIKKVATVLTLSDEMLEDAPAVQQFVNNQLAAFVRIESERQLLRGTSGGNEVQGLLTSRGVPVYAGGTAVGNKAVQLFKAMNGLRGSAFLEPDWIVLHPGDYEDIRLLTDSAGQLLGGGPFLGQYGNGSNLSASGQVTGAADTIWNKPVYVTSAIGATKGTALVGTREAAQVWNRGGLGVEATNSHASNFILNLSVIRAERRLGLAVYRSNGFVEVRLS
jgi:HK97 family phage major capsid protein